MTEAEYRQAVLEVNRQQLAAYEAWSATLLRTAILEIATKMTSPYKSPSAAQRNAILANADWVREQLGAKS